MDRPTGTLDVDPNGFASYSFPISLPKGIGEGNEPRLALRYSQNNNTSSPVGLRWTISGLSSIFQIPPSLALDSQAAVIAQDIRQLGRYAIDGSELACISGKFGTAGARYSTEIDTGQIVEHHQSGGFVVTDWSGRTREYGNSPDSVIMNSKGEIVEWKLNKDSDTFGNYVRYQYTSSPRRGPRPAPRVNDSHVSYLDTVTYTCNDEHGYAGGTTVDFLYEGRPDPATIAVHGQLSIIAHRLARVEVNLLQGSRQPLVRGYNMAYSTSATSQESLLTSITETGCNGGALDPTVFTYTAASSGQSFVRPYEQSTILPSSNSLGSLMPLNASGKGLCDLVSLKRNLATGELSLKTFLAEKMPETPSDRPAPVYWSGVPDASGDVSLPHVDQNRVPDVLVADLNRDGRSDIILPYRSSANDELLFAVARANGRGYDEIYSISTGQTWSYDARFFAFDTNGDGLIDIVQVRPGLSPFEHLITTFFDIDHAGPGQPPNTIHSEPWRAGGETIEWFVIAQHISGAAGLVQISNHEGSTGDSEARVTVFVNSGPPGSQNPFTISSTNFLYQYSSSDGATRSILCCDVNGDGAQDILLCTAKVSGSGGDSSYELSYAAFLHDGQGNFTLQSTSTLSARGPASKNPGTFFALNSDNSRLPTIAYVYQSGVDLSWVCMSGKTSASGSISRIDSTTIFSSAGLPYGKHKVWPADLNGTGQNDWLLYSLGSDAASVSAAYNNIGLVDYLQTVTSPLGLQQAISYRPLTTDVYTPSVSTATYAAPNDGSDADLLAAATHVVSRIEDVNDASKNGLPYAATYQYQYFGGKYSRSGRGWCGFSRTERLERISGVKVVTHYIQTFPFVGRRHRVDMHGSTTESLRARVQDPRRAWTQDNLELYQSQFWEYQHISLSAPSYPDRKLVRLLSDKTVSYDSHGSVARSIGNVYEYDGDSRNQSLQYSFDKDELSGALVSELWKRQQYSKPIAGRSALVTAYKASSSKDTDLTTWRPGDLRFETCVYGSRGEAVEYNTWSSDTNQFYSKRWTYDGFGNRSSESADTATRFTFDAKFPQYCVEVKKQGGSLTLMTRKAFDARWGGECVSVSASGNVRVQQHDEFGRIIAHGTNFRSEAGSMQSFDVTDAIAVSADLKTELATTSLSFMDISEYSEEKEGDITYIKTVTRKSFESNIPTVVVQYVDCVGRIRRCMEQHEDDASPAVWSGFEYDNLGNISQRMANSTEGNLRPGSVLTLDRSIQYCHDVLGREVLAVKASSQGRNKLSVISADYSDGGRRRTAQMSVAATIQDAAGTNLDMLESTTQTFVFANGKEQVKSLKINSGQASMFRYDALGRLVELCDPAGKIETRAYNTFGAVTVVNDPYRNALGERKGVVRKRNSANLLTEEENALGSVLKYSYDGLGRVVEKSGFNVNNRQTRRTTFDYVHSGFGSGSVAAVSIYDGTESIPSLQYTYKYNEQGLKSSESLKLQGKANGEWTQAWEYDRFGQVIRCTLPDGSKVESKYHGTMVTHRSLQGTQSEQPWKLDVAYNEFDASGAPTSWTLTGGGELSDFAAQGHQSFDQNGLPTYMDVGRDSKNVWADLSFEYDVFDQITMQKSMSDVETVNYTYADRRLASSKTQTGAAQYTERKYEYSASGDILSKDGMVLDYSIENGFSQITGSKNGQVAISSKSDAAGRTIERQVGSGPTMLFEYDENDKLCSIVDSAGTKTTLISNHQLQTIAQIEKDGTVRINIGTCYAEVLRPDGTKEISRHLQGHPHHLASVKTVYPPQNGKKILDLDFYMYNHKGTVTHIFAKNGGLKKLLQYDDFGAPLSQNARSDATSSTTFEGKAWLPDPGLFDFNARMYDPLLGRFTTPDTMLTEKQMVLPDGLNRMAFENNDPRNHTDPTGHLSWSFWVALVIGIVAIVAGVALTIVTAGAATPLLAWEATAVALAMGAINGAIIGGGIASVSYAVAHRNEEDAAKFWKGWAIDVAIGVGTGAVTGALGAGASLLTAVKTVGTAALETAEVAGEEVAEGAAESITTQAATKTTTAERAIISRGAKLFVFKAIMNPASNILSDYARIHAVDNYVYGKHEELTGWNALNDSITGVLSAYGTQGISSTLETETGAAFKAEAKGLWNGILDKISPPAELP